MSDSARGVLLVDEDPDVRALAAKRSRRDLPVVIVEAGELNALGQPS